MQVRRFDRFEEWKQAVIELMLEHFKMELDVPHAVMLPGGVTPVSIYRDMEVAPVGMDEKLHLIVSDDRYVAESSDFYNYGKMRGLVEHMGLDADKVIKVDTGIGFENSAGDFNGRLSSFLESGGRITLGLLGLGPDGHTASLFTDYDIRSAEGHYAVPVRMGEGPDRVSVTPGLLSCVERIVFLAAGESKADIIKVLEERPGDVIAGKAVAECGNVEVWFSRAKE